MPENLSHRLATLDRVKTALDIEIERDWHQPQLAGAPPGGWLGVDVGWVYPAVDSDGRIYRWASASNRRMASRDVPKASPVKVTKADGVSYEIPAHSGASWADLNARAKVNEDAQVVVRIVSQIVATAARTDRGIALEDWSDVAKRRTKWIIVHSAVVGLARKRGVAVRTVRRAYTSQTCPECGHVSPDNRPRRNSFKCQRCGYSGQADAVAARNLAASEAIIQPETAARCANRVCDRAVWKNQMCCSCYFYRRRYGVYPEIDRLDILNAADSAEDFNQRLRRVGRRAYRSRRYRPSPTEAAIADRLQDFQDRFARGEIDAWGNPKQVVEG